MSRPAYPQWTVPGFATDYSFPPGANPWSGQPTKVTYPGAAGGFVPNQPNAAQYYNWLHNTAFVIDQAALTFMNGMLDFVGQSQLWTTQSTQLSPGSLTPSNSAVSWPVYDPISKRWIIVAGLTAGAPGAVSSSGTGGNTSYISHDGGSSWVAVATGNSAEYFGLAAVNPNTGLTVIVSQNWDLVYTLPAESVTWSAGIATGFTVATNTTYNGSIVWVPFMASGFGAFLSVTPGFSGASRLVSGNTTGATWTDLSSSLPGGISSANTTHWSSASSSTRYVAVSQETGSAYFSTDDGITFTSRTLSALGANEHIFAIHYNVALNLWMLATGNTTTNASSKIYTSADGITWVLQSTLTSSMLPQTLSGMGTISILKVLKNPTASEPIKRCKLLISVDAGVTWRESDSATATSGTQHLASDGQRLMTSDYVGAVRGVYAAGLPPIVT